MAVRLANATLDEVSESGKPGAVGNGITAARQDGSAAVLEVGSGNYQFKYAMR